MFSSSHKIAVIGAGSVGSAIAHSLLIRRVVADIILVDIDDELCRGQVQDLSDATYLSNVRIRQGNHADAGQSDIIIISAGAKQRPNDTRLDLIGRNFKILKSVLDGMQPIRTDAILVLVANPVDILTFLPSSYRDCRKVRYWGRALCWIPSGCEEPWPPWWRYLGWCSCVTGKTLTGTLGRRYSRQRIHCRGAWRFSMRKRNTLPALLPRRWFVQVAWSSANVSGISLSSVLSLTGEDRSKIATTIKKKAYEIIKAKGFTSYGIGAVTSSICESIIFDQCQVFPLSHWQSEYRCCLSLPAVLGRAGLISTISLPLSEDETASIEDSAKTLREIIDKHSAELK